MRKFLAAFSLIIAMSATTTASEEFNAAQLAEETLGNLASASSRRQAEEITIIYAIKHRFKKNSINGLVDVTNPLSKK